MKNQQSNKLKMAQTTLGCVQHETNAPLWAGIVGIETLTPDKVARVAIPHMNVRLASLRSMR